MCILSHHNNQPLHLTNTIHDQHRSSACFGTRAHRTVSHMFRHQGTPYRQPHVSAPGHSVPSATCFGTRAHRTVSHMFRYQGTLYRQPHVSAPGHSLPSATTNCVDPVSTRCMLRSAGLLPADGQYDRNKLQVLQNNQRNIRLHIF